MAGSLGDLNSANRYVYVGDNPISLVDPSGKMPCWFAAFLAFLVILSLPLIIFTLPIDTIAFILFAIGAFSTSSYAFDVLLQACNPGAVP